MTGAAIGLAICLGGAGVMAGCGGTTTVTETTTVIATSTGETGLGPPAEIVQFGHITSLAPSGDHFEMRFDPAWFLTGETANVAAAEDGAVDPGEPVPNDNYVLEEGDRLLTYRVPADARVRVLTRTGEQFGLTPISVRELAQVLEGTSDLELFESLDTGVWLTIEGDTVQSIDQQYRP
jgi:hypothetical protein